MSKCDLQIVFDRTDRTYRGGDEVSGTVHVSVNADVQCNGFTLEHYWRTHGRGNTATGKMETVVLARGNWQAGQSYSYPFSFAAPDGPPTYRGRYLNIDHYVKARVDVPWAVDPKLEEEYILLPCGREYGNRPFNRQLQHAGLKQFAVMGAPFGIGLILFGIFFMFPCGLVLIPVGLAVLFFSLRKIIAEKRIGTVKLGFGSLTVSPGGQVLVKLDFTPRMNTKLNGITAKLVGKETCVSGSGTNKKTHAHEFHKQSFSLTESGEVQANRPVKVEKAVPIPRTDAYTFSARNNDLIWELEVRVDIPLWPDWIEKRVLIVRPPISAEVVETELVEEQKAASVTPAAPISDISESTSEPDTVTSIPEQTWSSATGAAVPDDSKIEADAESPLPHEETADEPPITRKPEVEKRPAASPLSGGVALVGVIDQLVAADRYGGKREEIIKDREEQSFECPVKIEKIERTYSYIPDERFRNSRTVTGKLAGTDHKITIQLSAEWNEKLEPLGPGDQLQANAKLLKWNVVYDRVELREA